MSGLFLVIQIILLIDFAFEWAQSWRSSDGEGNNIWDYLMLVAAIILLILAIGLIVVTIVFFNVGPTCHLNRFFTISTIVVSIGLVLLCLVRGYGLLPSAVVVCYAAFTLWSAMLSDPSTTCNRLTGGSKHNRGTVIATSVFGVLIAAFSLVRCTVSTGQSFSSFFSLQKSQESAQLTEEEEEERKRTECREIFFSHLVFLFGSFYMAMILVSWDIVGNERSQKYQTEVSKCAVWVKIVSQWVTFGIFFWSLVAPKILGRWRDFDEFEQ
jgi:hypothetical protein